MVSSPEDVELIPGNAGFLKPFFNNSEEERAHSEQAFRDLMVSYAVQYVKYGNVSDFRLLPIDIIERAEKMRRVYLRHHPEEVERMRLIEENRRKETDLLKRVYL